MQNTADKSTFKPKSVLFNTICRHVFVLQSKLVCYQMESHPAREHVGVREGSRRVTDAKNNSNAFSKRESHERLPPSTRRAGVEVPDQRFTERGTGIL